MDPQDKQSALFDVFRKYYSRLETLASTCVTSIASKLYSYNLISGDVQDQVVTGGDSDSRKASKVLHNVKQQIKVDPGKLRTLVKVLKEEPVFDDLAEDIMSDMNSPCQEKVVSPIPVCLRYREYLKSIYDRDPIARDDKLAISPCSDFISLALINKEQSPSHGDAFSKSTFHGGVDEILASKTPLELDALVTPGSPFVLVEGPPGIGKSTMCWELCRNWETLKSLQDFKIVLQLKLREKRVQNATSLQQLFYHEDEVLTKGMVLNDFSGGEGVLLVLDGFDELPSSVVGDESSLIMRLIRGQCLPKAKRLVTSRPSALHQKKIHFPQEYRHVEILGFTDECKVQFAEKAFETEPKILARFKEFISSNPIIISLMYIPVNCAIIAQVYKDLPDITVPKTMTQLYTLLVLVLIRRHLIQTGRWTVESKVPANLEGLSEDIKADLMRVSKLAYEGLIKKDITFSDEDVGESFQHLGLLNEAKEMYVSKGAVTYYSFLHLSIQEFLAAWYVNCHPHLASNWITTNDPYNPRHYRSFLRFLSGLGNSYDLVFSHLFSNCCSIDFIVSCCYEAQDISALESHKNQLKFYTSIALFNPWLMYTFGYVLVKTPVRWTIQAGTSFGILASSIADHAPDGKILGSIEAIGISGIQLNSLPKCLLKSITAIPLDLDTVPAIPSLSNLQKISLCFSDRFSPTIIQSLWSIASLKEMEVDTDVSLVVGQSLSRFFASTSTLERVSITGFKFSGGINLYRLVLWELQKVVEAALSCSSLKHLTTSVPFFTSHIPNSLERLEFQFKGWAPLEELVDCLCSTDMCKSLSTLTAFYSYGLKVPETFFAFLNNSLHSKPSLTFEVRHFEYSLSDLPSLSSALRKDPDVARLNLQRSKSVSDLSTLKVKDESRRCLPWWVVAYCESERNTLKRHQSCPDLLEMESLHSIHPKLLQAMPHFYNYDGKSPEIMDIPKIIRPGSKQFYFQHAELQK